MHHETTHQVNGWAIAILALAIIAGAVEQPQLTAKLAIYGVMLVASFATVGLIGCAILGVIGFRNFYRKERKTH